MGVRISENYFRIYDNDGKRVTKIPRGQEIVCYHSFTRFEFGKKKLYVSKFGFCDEFDLDCIAKRDVKLEFTAEVVLMILCLISGLSLSVVYSGNPPNLVSKDGVFEFKFGIMEYGLYKNGQISKYDADYIQPELRWLMWLIGINVPNDMNWFPGDTLIPGSRLEELRNGNYTLKPTLDGRLEVNGQTFTLGNKRHYTTEMNKYGNLVAYDQNMKWVWSTGPKQGASLTLTDDGKVVLLGKVLFEYKLVNASNVLLPGEEMPYVFGEKHLKTKVYGVTQQAFEPCTFVIHKLEESYGRAFDLGIKSCYNIVMQKDGNLVALDINKNPVWASNTTGNVHLELSNEGQLYLKRNNKTIIYTF